MNQSTQLARVIVRQIIEAGIKDVVISPGSRNAPLSIALYAASKRDLITIHVRIDERTAAFFALGIAKATHHPVPVICTSGTAVANFHPAVLEASHSNAPLFIITADRPASLRRTGANQTTEQAHIFGKAVRYFADISGAAYPLELPLNALQSGPVHLNIQFEEPLVADGDESWLSGLTTKEPPGFSRKEAEIFKSKSTRGLLIVGHDRAGFSVEEVLEFAEQLRWPLITEDPLSFPNAQSHASVFLTSQKISEDLRPDTVIIIGRTTLSRSINSLIKSARHEVVVDPRMLTVDTDRVAVQRFFQLPKVEVPETDSDWSAKWGKYSNRALKVIAAIEQWSEPLVARTIATYLPDDCTLYISSSRPIRDIEGFASARSRVETFANRGLAGIDGNISTSLGIAYSRRKSYAILGDLSFLHDLTGLLTDEAVNLKIFVINNDGGGIFSTLSQRGVEGFERIFGTPQGKDLEAIVKAMGIAAKRIKNKVELIAEVQSLPQGLSVVIIDVPDREKNADLIKDIYAQMDSL